MGAVMVYLQPATGGLDYYPCHYGGSRLNFRGPERDLSGAYLALLGGSETFGRLVATPFAVLLEEELALPVANLGNQNAGPDLYLADRAALKVAMGAQAAVVQITGAHNLTNRFYRVHPRRNDRFVAATPVLRALYRDVDFAEIHFTRHLMQVLRSRGAERFALVVSELKVVWLQRMTELLEALPKQRLLLWVADRAPELLGQCSLQGHAPWFVDTAMVQALRPLVQDYVEVVVERPCVAAEGSNPEEPGACGMPDAAGHRAVALALGERLAALL